MPSVSDRKPPQQPSTARPRAESYLSWIQLGAVAICVVLAVWAFPDAGELSGQLARGELGSEALAEAERDLRGLQPGAGALSWSRALRRLGVAQGSCGNADAMVATLVKAARSTPRWLAGQLTLADVYHALARPGDELPVILDALRVPQVAEQLPRAELRSLLADFEFARRGHPPAWRDLPVALERELLPWRRRAAHELDFEQRTDEAIEQYRRIAGIGPGELSDSLRLVQLLTARGQEAEARQLFERAILAVQPRRGEESLAARYGQLRAAGSVSRLLCDVRPDLHLRQSSLSQSRPSTGDAAVMAAVLESLRHALATEGHTLRQLDRARMEVTVRRGDWEARYRLAVALEERDELREALEQYREIRRILERDDAFEEQFLDLLRRLGDTRELSIELTNTYGRRPTLGVGLELARAYQRLGRRDDALEVFRNLLARYPDNAEVMLGLAAELIERGRDAEARPLLEKASGQTGVAPPPAAPQPLLTAIFGQRAAPQTGQWVRRRLLALYKGSELADASETRIHLFLEVVCDWLGLVVDYRDVELDLPSSAKMEPYAGVVTWFDSPQLYHPREFLAWLARQSQQGRKLVMLGGLGALVDAATGQPVPPALLDAALAPLGLRHGAVEVPGGPLVTVEGKPSPLVEFERKLERELPYFESVKSVDPANQVLLSLSYASAPPARGDAVVLSKNGLYVTQGYAGYTDPISSRRQLRIDAFTLLARLFGDDHPVPDPSTVDGFRAAVIQVDADGAENATTVRGFASCTEVLTERIFSRFHLEATVSFVGSAVDPGRPGTADQRREAERLFGLPWIEAASHGYSHVYDWRSPSVRGPLASAWNSAYGAQSYMLEREIRGSVQVMAKLSQARTAVPVLLWSGLANPDEQQLAFARHCGILAINGGDGRCDNLYPSVTQLSPWTRPVGQERQVLSPLASDLALTSDGGEPLFAFRKLAQSWDRSGSPRRLKPAGLYFHQFLARSEEGLATVEWLFRRIQAGPFTVVPASEFVRQVEGARATRLSRLGPGRFRVEDAGRCLTMRCLPALGVPDLKACDGVAGYVTEGDRTYIHLVPGRQQEIAFSKSPEPVGLWLHRTNLRLVSWQVGSRGAEAFFLGHGNARVELAGQWTRKRPSVVVMGAGGEQLPARLGFDAAGRMTVEAQASGQLRLILSLDRPADE